MENGIGKLDFTNVKSAIAYGLVTAFLVVLETAIESLITSGNLFAINWKELANTSILSGLVVVVSLIKNLLTTSAGNFLGLMKVIPEIK